MKKSVFGLNENLAGLLSYLGVFVSGIIILILERENRFVRFHALQSTVTFLTLSVASWVVGIIPILGWMASGIIGLVSFICWAYLMYTAYKGQTVKVPFIGEAVWNVINK